MRLKTDRMFYERDILEGLTKKTFYDSPRIVLTDLEQSLLEKTSTSLVCSIIYKHVDTAIKCVTSTCGWTLRSRIFPQLPLAYDPVTPSRRVAPPPCEPSVAGPARSRAFTGVQRSPERRPVQRIKLSQFAPRVRELLFSFPTRPTPPKRHRATS